MPKEKQLDIRIHRKPKSRFQYTPVARGVTGFSLGPGSWRIRFGSPSGIELTLDGDEKYDFIISIPFVDFIRLADEVDRFAGMEGITRHSYRLDNDGKLVNSGSTIDRSRGSFQTLALSQIQQTLLDAYRSIRGKGWIGSEEDVREAISDCLTLSSESSVRSWSDLQETNLLDLTTALQVLVSVLYDRGLMVDDVRSLIRKSVIDEKVRTHLPPEVLDKLDLVTREVPTVEESP